MTDYPAFGKIPRLNREVVWTEKIDGTNGLISIEEKPFGESSEVEDSADWFEASGITCVIPPSTPVNDQDLMPEYEYWVRAGSRNRWLTGQQDNYGFAQWVRENALVLADILGPGLHYGEWWGQGIQRRYDRDRKIFSLFNVRRWEWVRNDGEAQAIGLDVVPLLGVTIGFDDTMPLNKLAVNGGSFAAPGFKMPEGVVGYHEAGRHTYKVLLVNDDKPKGN